VPTCMERYDVRELCPQRGVHGKRRDESVKTLDMDDVASAVGDLAVELWSKVIVSTGRPCPNASHVEAVHVFRGR
jgi:hypothetical protein